MLQITPGVGVWMRSLNKLASAIDALSSAGERAGLKPATLEARRMLNQWGHLGAEQPWSMAGIDKLAQEAQALASQMEDALLQRGHCPQPHGYGPAAERPLGGVEDAEAAGIADIASIPQPDTAYPRAPSQQLPSEQAAAAAIPELSPGFGGTAQQERESDTHVEERGDRAGERGVSAEQLRYSAGHMVSQSTPYPSALRTAAGVGSIIVDQAQHAVTADRRQTEHLGQAKRVSFAAHADFDDGTVEPLRTRHDATAAAAEAGAEQPQAMDACAAAAQGTDMGAGTGRAGVGAAAPLDPWGLYVSRSSEESARSRSPGPWASFCAGKGIDNAIDVIRNVHAACRSSTPRPVIGNSLRGKGTGGKPRCVQLQPGVWWNQTAHSKGQYGPAAIDAGVGQAPHWVDGAADNVTQRAFAERFEGGNAQTLHSSLPWPVGGGPTYLQDGDHQGYGMVIGDIPEGIAEWDVNALLNFKRAYVRSGSFKSANTTGSCSTNTCNNISSTVTLMLEVRIHIYSCIYIQIYIDTCGCMLHLH